MKTNQIMLREDFIQQRTSDGYFNATSTLKNWNENNPKARKQLNDYQKINPTKEFVNYLRTKENIENPYIATRLGTWMHPLLYIDFCMWISVEFKAMALKYALDGLIKMRHNAGDYYTEMCNVIMNRYIEYYNCKPAPMIYVNEALMINEIAGVTCPRNEMTEEQLAKITILQKVNAQLIREKVGIESRKRQLNVISRAYSFNKELTISI